MSIYQITYEFEFQNGKKIVYPLQLDKDTISLISDRKSPLPPWTKLEHCQCKVCPLSKDKTPYCPIAANIAGLIEKFKDINSNELVRISVFTAERTYIKEAAAQKGFSSIFGIIMATSNCPIMNFLKPMARYHLPFSTDEETIVRSISIYLLSQYFIAKKRGQPDLSLENLDRAYSLVQKVNQGICDRISSAIRQSQSPGDAVNNAIVILDVLSQLLTTEIEQKLDSFAMLFEINLGKKIGTLPYF
jgi:Tfp pilus assembly PilM family ATPase